MEPAWESLVFAFSELPGSSDPGFTEASAVAKSRWPSYPSPPESPLIKGPLDNRKTGSNSQASLDFEHSSGFFIGTWISQADMGADKDRASIEVNPYMGRRFSLSEDWRAEAMVAGLVQ